MLQCNMLQKRIKLVYTQKTHRLWTKCIAAEAFSEKFIVYAITMPNLPFRKGARREKRRSQPENTFLLGDLTA